MLFALIACVCVCVCVCVSRVCQCMCVCEGGGGIDLRVCLRLLSDHDVPVCECLWVCFLKHVLNAGR